MKIKRKMTHLNLLKEKIAWALLAILTIIVLYSCEKDDLAPLEVADVDSDSITEYVMYQGELLKVAYTIGQDTIIPSSPESEANYKFIAEKMQDENTELLEIVPDTVKYIFDSKLALEEYLNQTYPGRKESDENITAKELHRIVGMPSEKLNKDFPKDSLLTSDAMNKELDIENFKSNNGFSSYMFGTGEVEESSLKAKTGLNNWDAGTSKVEVWKGKNHTGSYLECFGNNNVEDGTGIKEFPSGWSNEIESYKVRNRSTKMMEVTFYESTNHTGRSFKVLVSNREGPTSYITSDPDLSNNWAYSSGWFNTNKHYWHNRIKSVSWRFYDKNGTSPSYWNTSVGNNDIIVDNQNSAVYKRYGGVTTWYNNSGTRSIQTIPANTDGFFEVDITYTNYDRLFGLRYYGSSMNWNDIDFSAGISHYFGNIINLFSNGVSKTYNRYNYEGSDVLRVERRGTNVYVYLNSAYIGGFSGVDYNRSLYAGCAFYQGNYLSVLNDFRRGLL